MCRIFFPPFFPLAIPLALHESPFPFFDVLLFPIHSLSLSLLTLLSHSESLPLSFIPFLPFFCTVEIRAVPFLSSLVNVSFLWVSRQFHLYLDLYPAHLVLRIHIVMIMLNYLFFRLFLLSLRLRTTVGLEPVSP